MGKKKAILLLIFASMMGLKNPAQSCKFSVQYAGQPYSMNTLIYTPTDTAIVMQLKCYVRYLHPKKQAWEHQLMDFYLSQKPIELKLPRGADSIQLFFGVDSSLQEKGVGTGDLDPKNNMYWGWFPGYIGVKVEGISELYGGFEYHLGGFRRFNANQSYLWVKAGGNYSIDVGEFISKIPKEKEGKIMSPGHEIPRFTQFFVESIHERK